MRAHFTAAAVSALLVVPLVPQGARAQFSIPADVFFSLAAPMSSYTFAGCVPMGYGIEQYRPCASMSVEVGIEAATGLGALRYWASADEEASNGYIEGSPQPLFFSHVAARSGVRRSGGSSGQWESWQPDARAAAIYGMTFRYLPNPGESCGSPIDGRCGTEDAARMLLTSAVTRPALVTPEPSTWALLGTGLLTLGGIAAKRRTHTNT